MKIRRNDNVLILAGKDKGKTGIVEKVFPETGRFVVKGIALAKKHIKPSKQNPKGGIIDINLSINSSNAMVVCPSCSKPTKISYSILSGKKIRVCKKCKQSLEVIATK